jgi:hypothetical protein
MGGDGFVPKGHQKAKACNPTHPPSRFWACGTPPNPRQGTQVPCILLIFGTRLMGTTEESRLPPVRQRSIFPVHAYCGQQDSSPRLHRGSA